MNEEQQQNEEQKWIKNNNKMMNKNEWKSSSEENNNNSNQHHKNLLEVLPSKYHRWEILLSQLPIKKTITEVLLILPLYLILFFIWWQFRHLIKAMADVGNILNDDDFFGDIVDTPRKVPRSIKNENA